MEMLVIPVMAFHFLSFLPARWVLNPQSRWSRFAGVCGQYIFIRRAVYQKLGGHQTVKNEIVEDLSLGKIIVKAGYRLILGNGSPFSFCRMYTRSREVWEGFSKNFFPATGYSVSSFLMTLGALWINGVFPFIVLIWGGHTFLFWSSLALCLTLWLVRLLEAFHFRFNKISVAFHPMGCFLFSLIGLNSYRWFCFKGYGLWKGRKLLKPPV
jgi:chlorobactene glucosyltransferase